LREARGVAASDVVEDANIDELERRFDAPGDLFVVN
jgi:hypothetical protein